MRAGILCVDKPQDFTSFDVVAKARGMLKTRQIGHAGTLDPLATGVLPLFVGRATKACDILPVHDKRYTASFRLGTVTDTQDITGEVLSAYPVNVSPREVQEVVKSFAGPQQQIPPMYSAVKVGGKKLYDLARKGIEVERKPRDIHIYAIELLETGDDHTYTIDVSCSKGTYVRTLCHDIGESLGCGAVLTALRRTEACGFTLKDCLPLEEADRLAAAGELEEKILPLEAAFAALPRLSLSGDHARLFQNGVRLRLEQVGLTTELSAGNTEFAVFGVDSGFLAVAEADYAAGLLRCKKLFALPD